MPPTSSKLFPSFSKNIGRFQPFQGVATETEPPGPSSACRVVRNALIFLSSLIRLRGEATNQIQNFLLQARFFNGLSPSFETGKTLGSNRLSRRGRPFTAAWTSPIQARCALARIGFQDSNPENSMNSEK
jgi:hypothetical protein